VHEHALRTRIVVHEGPVTEPVDDVLRVRGAEYLRERIGRRQLAAARDRREQVQVVVAEHAGHAAPEVHHAAQHAQRLRATIDEVANEPQPIARRAKRELAQQRVERRAAALDVTDRVERHRNYRC